MRTTDVMRSHTSYKICQVLISLFLENKTDFCNHISPCKLYRNYIYDDRSMLFFLFFSSVNLPQSRAHWLDFQTLNTTRCLLLYTMLVEHLSCLEVTHYLFLYGNEPLMDLYPLTSSIKKLSYILPLILDICHCSFIVINKDRRTTMTTNMFHLS